LPTMPILADVVKSCRCDSCVNVRDRLSLAKPRPGGVPSGAQGWFARRSAARVARGLYRAELDFATRNGAAVNGAWRPRGPSASPAATRPAAAMKSSRRS
jgi:hypothetical protein